MASRSRAPAIERLLSPDSAITMAGLVLLCALSWLHLWRGAGLGMSALDMTTLSLFPHKAAGAAMPGMTMAAAEWDVGRWTLTAAMWWTMMVAMMAPSAAPAVLLYGRVYRQAMMRDQRTGLAPSWAFAIGYFIVWLGFSLAACALQWGLERSELVSIATMGSQSRWLSAVLLAAAGAYQLSPLQNACLNHCRSPATFFARHWHPRFAGAVRLGLLHGAYCVGCCWLLMALLFVGGVMNMAWVAALTVLVVTQKIAAGGRWVASASGVALVAWAVATLLA